MLDKFLTHFALAPISTRSVEAAIELLSGQSFGDGIFRFLTESQVLDLEPSVRKAFRPSPTRIFGMDWAGRVFGLDEAGAVSIYEPGTGESFSTAVDLLTFLEVEIPCFEDDALLKQMYLLWRQAGGAAPATHQCVAYKTPLFLGGADTVENLELADVSVTWMIAAGLLEKIKG